MGFEYTGEGCTLARAMPAACLSASPLQGCWPAWWSRTSRCAGGRESASAACTSRGSRTAGNAPAPIKPSGSSLGVRTVSSSSWAWWLWAAALLYVTLCPRKGDHSDKSSAKVEPGDKEKPCFPPSPSCEGQEHVVLRRVPAAAAEGKLQCPDALGRCLGAVAEDCGRRGRTRPAGGGSGIVGTLMRRCAGRSWLWLVSACGRAFSSPLPRDIGICFLSLSHPSPNLLWVLTHALAVAKRGGSWTEPVLCWPPAALPRAQSWSRCGQAGPASPCPRCRRDASAAGLPGGPWQLCCWVRPGWLSMELGLVPGPPRWCWVPWLLS